MARINNDSPAVLTLNAGLSSVKRALFRVGLTPVRTAARRIERIGLPDGIVTVLDVATGRIERRTAEVPNHAASVRLLIDQLAQSGKGLSSMCAATKKKARPFDMIVSNDLDRLPEIKNWKWSGKR